MPAIVLPAEAPRGRAATAADPNVTQFKLVAGLTAAREVRRPVKWPDRWPSDQA